MGKLQEALADFNRAIELDPQDQKFKSYYSNRGTCLLQMGRFDEGLADYTKAIELDPSNAERYHWRSHAYIALNQYDKAVADMTEAMNLRPQDPSLASCFAVLLADTAEVRDANRALAIAQQAVQADPTNAVYLRRLGQVYYRLGRHDQAIATLLKALQAHNGGPDSNDKRNAAWAFLYLAMSQHELGKSDMAKEYYQKALMSMKEYLTNDKGLAQVWETRRKEAEKLLEREGK